MCISQWGHEINYFGNKFLAYHFYAFRLTDLYPGVKKKIYEQIMQFHNMTCMTTPWHKNLCTGLIDFTVRLILHIITINIKFFIPISRNREDFSRKTSSLRFLPYPWARGDWICKFPFPYPVHATILIKTGSVVPMLADEERRTPHKDGSSSITKCHLSKCHLSKCHLSYSGDLNIFKKHKKELLMDYLTGPTI